MMLDRILNYRRRGMTDRMTFDIHWLDGLMAVVAMFDGHAARKQYVQ